MVDTKRIGAAIICSCFLVSGCSTSSKDIAPTYVSPLQYTSYDCEQISAENARLASKVAQLSGRLDEAAANDKAITGVGMILFWPALFALGGTKQQEAEYAKLKGEHDALQQAAIQKKCSTSQAPTLEAKKVSEPPAEGAVATADPATPTAATSEK